MASPEALEEILIKNALTFAKVIDTPLTNANVIIFDFTKNNKSLDDVDLLNTLKFNEYITSLLKTSGAKVGAGGYHEHRTIYKRSDNFQGDEPRSIHLGIDLWTKANENVYTPLNANLHSFADNKGFGNYGPTIILEHTLEENSFYTLYGHLSVGSLKGLKEGMSFNKGEKIGEVGNFPENGDWPPHLHFQVIEDISGYWGDYPGVSAPSEKEKYLANCPDPNLILGIEKVKII